MRVTSMTFARWEKMGGRDYPEFIPSLYSSRISKKGQTVVLGMILVLILCTPPILLNSILGANYFFLLK